MKRTLLAISLFLLAALGASAQSTTVIGTVQDTGGQLWFGGTFTWSFVPNPAFPAGPYLWPGGTIPPTVSGAINGSGLYTASLPSNTAISPIGSQWNLVVCPQATSPCYNFGNITIAGATQTVNVAPPVIAISLINPPSSVMLAYSDSEIASAHIGSFYFNVTDSPNNYHFCLTTTTQDVCTLWNTFGASGPPVGFPRLDQVLNQNTNKLFNQGSATLGFTGGPGLDLGGETSPMRVPNVAACTPSLLGQFCVDSSASNYLGYNGSVNNFALFPSTVGSGDVAGFLLMGSTWSVQDLGTVNQPSGLTFWLVNMTSPLDGDIPCWDTTGPPFVNNCTPGIVGSSITGATSTYTVTLADNVTRIDHDPAASVSATISLPTATTLGFPNFGFYYTNHSTHADTVTPVTWTINGSASIPVAANSFCQIWVDPNSATNWLADCVADGGGGTVTSVGLTTPSWLSVAGSPVITSGTLAVTAATGQTSHQVIGTCGAATSFAPCTIVEGDLPTATVFTDQNATFGAHNYDFSGSTITKLRVGAGLTTSANGDFGFDSTNLNWHGWNGADRLFPPLASGFVSGHCGQPTSTSGKWEIADAGAACGAGGGGAPTTANYVLGTANGTLTNATVFFDLVNSPDVPPASPNALDDEMNAAAGGINTGLWTWVNQSGSTANYSGTGYLDMSFPGSHAGSDSISFVEQSAPAAPYEFETKLSCTSVISNAHKCGIALRESATSKFVWCGVNVGTTAGIQLVCENFTNNTTFANTRYQSTNQAVNAFYVRVGRLSSGTNPLYFDYSIDGRGWIRVYNPTLTADFTTAPDKVDLMGESSASTTTDGIFWWFRRTI